jgi:hypothetical protein
VYEFYNLNLNFFYPSCCNMEFITLCTRWRGTARGASTTVPLPYKVSASFFLFIPALWHNVSLIFPTYPNQVVFMSPSHRRLFFLCVRNPSSVTNYTNSIYEQFYCRTYCTVNKTRYTVDSGEKEKGKTIVS